MSDPNFQFDSALIRELRKLACDGAQPADLIRLIQQREGYSPDFIVPVLAYLRHTFDVSLRTILPLREEMGVGPESRALRIVFWFAAAMLANEDWLPWDWPEFQAKTKNGFNQDELAAWPGGPDKARIEYCPTSDGVFARGTLTFESADQPNQAIRDRIVAFAKEHRNTVDQMRNGFAGEYATRMTLDFQMPQGANRQVTCIVWTLKGLSKHKAQPSLVAVS